MLIQAISNYKNYGINKNSNRNNFASFKSNYEREAELRRLRQLEEERERLRQQMLELAREEARKRAEAERARKEAEELKKQQTRERILEEVKKEIPAYPDLDNEMSTKMAGFLSQFTCAIQNNSEHDIREFFGDEETAAELRKKLSPECQHDSIELREELKKTDEVKDPVMMLIAANRMKKFMPKPGVLTPEQQENLLQGLKDTITMAVQNGDMSKYDEDDKIAIGEMVQMIKASDSTDFGISVKLKALVDKLNKKNLNIGFIPPVQVRELQTETKKQMNNA